MSNLEIVAAAVTQLRAEVDSLRAEVAAEREHRSTHCTPCLAAAQNARLQEIQRRQAEQRAREEAEAAERKRAAAEAKAAAYAAALKAPAVKIEIDPDYRGPSGARLSFCKVGPIKLDSDRGPRFRVLPTRDWLAIARRDDAKAILESGALTITAASAEEVES